jgi:outer membrane PBP1 activator LpoA protein
VLELGDLNEFRTSLEQALLLEQSSTRTKVLEQVLGVPLTAELRRRADLDLVILLADPAATHSIRSLLTYLYAGDVTVWGTSLGSTGVNTRATDSDLEGLRFLDMPWFAPREAELHAVMGETLPQGPMSRLVALGVDAARLQSRLALFEWLPGAGLAGASGDISRDSKGRLRRTSEWFRITNGLAAPESAGLPAPTPDSTEGNSTWTQPTSGLAAPVSSAEMPSSVH